MRILDQDSDQSMNHVLLLLTPEEAGELRDSLEGLLSNQALIHRHIDDPEYRHELTVAIYTTENMDGFHPRVKKLIQQDE